MAKLNVQEVASQVMSRKVDRVDIAMLEALEAAPKQTLRLEDRIEVVKSPPPPNAPPGAPPVYRNKVTQGLESAVRAWCESRMDLTVVQQEPIVERHAKSGELLTHKRDPIFNTFSIARLERMTTGTSECPALIEHVGGADEETAKMPTRLLQLSATGEIMLTLWRENKVPGVPYPDPPAPVAAEAEPEPQTKAVKRNAVTA